MPPPDTFFQTPKTFTKNQNPSQNKNHHNENDNTLLTTPEKHENFNFLKKSDLTTTTTTTPDFKNSSLTVSEFSSDSLDSNFQKDKNVMDLNCNFMEKQQENKVHQISINSDLILSDQLTTITPRDLIQKIVEQENQLKEQEENLQKLELNADYLLEELSEVRDVLGCRCRELEVREVQVIRKFKIFM